MTPKQYVLKLAMFNGIVDYLTNNPVLAKLFLEKADEDFQQALTDFPDKMHNLLVTNLTGDVTDEQMVEVCKEILQETMEG